MRTRLRRFGEVIAVWVAVICLLQFGYWTKSAVDQLTKVQAQTFPTFFARLLSSADPCMDPMVAKSSIALNVASATTTQHVAPSGTLTVYACSWSLTAAGTSPSYQFISGTGATCGTATVTNTGTYLPIVSQPVAVTDTGSIFKTAAGAGVCSVVAGTGPSVQGILTYVQQ